MQSLRKTLTTVGPAIILASVLCRIIPGQSALTTIQDTLFNADGARYNGTLTIQWSTFDAGSPGTIVQQGQTVQVVNGNLLVQLAANSTATPPANIYTVLFQSNGNQQYTETWSVRASTTPLTVPQVRTGTVSAGGSAELTGPIAESSVSNLISDLTARPIKGSGYGTNAVAVIDENGQIETAVGSPGNCVFVSGASGPCSAGGAGATGATGSTGPAGSAGARGATGATGTNGSNGAAGATGATGVAGATGTAGAAGTNGSNGSTGAAGSNGATGANGANGANGTAGATGASGVAGATGATGATGAAGTLGTVIPVSSSRAVAQSDCGNTLQATASVTVTLPGTLTPNCQLALVSGTSSSLALALSGGATFNGATSGLPVETACSGAICPGQTITMTGAGNWVSGSGPVGPVGPTGATGPAGGGFDPTDPTQFYMTHNTVDTGAAGANAWSYSGGCATSGGTGSTDIFQSTLTPGYFWASTSSSNNCVVYWPYGSDYQNGSYDYWSGSSPARLYITSTAQVVNTNGTVYVGLFGGGQSTGSYSEFIGCRVIGSGHWFSVIRHSGSDVATADTGLAVDTAAPHRVQVDNGASAAVANSLRCLVDGTNAATASGTIPAQPATNQGWYYGWGVQAASSSAAVLDLFQFTLWARGLPRN